MLTILWGLYIWAKVFIYSQSCADKIISGILMLMSIFILIDMINKRRRAFSRYIFDDKGVTNKCFAAKDIFIAWVDCKEIGVAKMPRGYGLYNVCLYFSKHPLSEKEIKWIQRLKNNDQHLWVIYSEELLNEVLSYVDLSTIRNLHTVTVLKQP